MTLPELDHRRAIIDRRAVAGLADEVDVDPIVALPGILEEPKRVTVGRDGASNFRDDCVTCSVRSQPAACGGLGP